MISSTANDRVKRVIRLQKDAKARADEGVYVIEGFKLLAEAPKGLVREVYVREDLDEVTLRFVSEAAAGAFATVSASVFARMSATRAPQGVLAVVAMTRHDPAALFARSRPLLLLLEDMKDPGNLGTIIRAAEAAAVNAIISGGDCVDIHNPKTVRAAAGSLFRLPFAHVPDLRPVIAELRDRGTVTYAACPAAGMAYDAFAYHGGTAFLIGNESHGLRNETMVLATGIRIPMSGHGESLNAATAAAVLVFEAARQRRAREKHLIGDQS